MLGIVHISFVAFETAIIATHMSSMENSWRTTVERIDGADVFLGNICIKLLVSLWKTDYRGKVGRRYGEDALLYT